MTEWWKGINEICHVYLPNRNYLYNYVLAFEQIEERAKFSVFGQVKEEELSL